jgi:hypothetical protein
MRRLGGLWGWCRRDGLFWYLRMIIYMTRFLLSWKSGRYLGSHS